MTPAVLRTLRILDYLARNGAQRLSDLAREFDLPKSNIHRLLQSLIEEDYAVKELDSGRYVASIKLFELGSLIANRDPVKRAGSAFLQQLHQATGETVVLARLVDSDVIYIDRIQSSNPLRVSQREGGRAPAAFTAAGKVILAHHPDAEALLDQIIATVPEAKKLDRAALMDEFAVIRDQGYAVSRSGWTRGINSVACAIGVRNLAPLGALALVVPSERLPDENIPQAALAVLTASAQINDLLNA